MTERSKDTNHGSRGNHLDVLTTHETVQQNDFNHPSADFQYKMEENFNSQFKKEKLTANTNDSEIVRYQEIGK